uniref:Uncharacterized protein n=1 Tax=Aplysina aerophoba bacterial symbiont clone pAE27P20 TaxID=377636 RepID=A4U8P2_9BACT|nr:hypothetical protein [Aplysina aerophoba bacterial symbiont clone pAE27P20]
MTTTVSKITRNSHVDPLFRMDNLPFMIVLPGTVSGNAGTRSELDGVGTTVTARDPASRVLAKPPRNAVGMTAKTMKFRWLPESAAELRARRGSRHLTRAIEPGTARLSPSSAGTRGRPRVERRRQHRTRPPSGTRGRPQTACRESILGPPVPAASGGTRSEL